VIAAARCAARAGLSDVMTFDMGGTSTDVALFRGAARTTSEAQLTGLPVAVPVLDIQTVGAGGGSIASLDAGGALRVGPESAGADPGPACYGKGTLPTVTDANLVLGRLGRGGLLAGAIPLDAGRANEALDRLSIALSRFASRRVTREAAALGLIRVANANMERALRLVSIERGQDPRLFTLLSFGGAGGLHAAALAAALRIPRVIVPADPGNFSALGVLLADVSKDYSRTVMREVTAGLDVELARQFSALERQAARDLRDEGFDAARRKFHRRLAMRYRGQSFELEVDWRRDYVAAFHRAHRERYGQSDASRPVEVVSVRLRAVGITEKPSLRRAREIRRGRARPSDRTFIWTEAGRVRAAVYDRDRLEAGLRLEAPAIVTEYGATTFIPPGWSCRIDRDANLLLDSAHGLT
jgi:N-methylhydantoinase A